MVTADSLDLAKVAGRRDEDAARPDHRLEDERCDALGAQPLDLGLERSGLVPLNLRRPFDEWAELVLVRHPQDARADAVGAVVPARSADQVLPLRLAPEPVPEPRELRRGFDRVAPAVREEDLRARLRRQRREPLGQLERGPVREITERVEALQLGQLGRDRVDDLGAAVPDVRVPEARCPVEIAAPLVVPDEDALASDEHELRARDRRHVGERMPESRQPINRPATAGPPIAAESSSAASTRRPAASSSRSSNRKRGAETLSAATIAPVTPRIGAAAATSPGSNSSRTIANPWTATAAMAGRAKERPRRSSSSGARSATRTRPAEVVPSGVRPPTRPGACSVAAGDSERMREHHVPLSNGEVDALPEGLHELPENRPRGVQEPGVGGARRQAEHPPAEAVRERVGVALDVPVLVESLERPRELALVAVDQLREAHDTQSVASDAGIAEPIEHLEAANQSGCTRVHGCILPDLPAKMQLGLNVEPDAGRNDAHARGASRVRRDRGRANGSSSICSAS